MDGLLHSRHIVSNIVSNLVVSCQAGKRIDLLKHSYDSDAMEKLHWQLYFGIRRQMQRVYPGGTIGLH